MLWHAYLVLQLAWYVAGEKLGFNGSPPAYLSPQASGKNLLIGANFASAGSGYYDPTSRMYVSTISIGGLSWHFNNNGKKQIKTGKIDLYSWLVDGFIYSKSGSA